MSDDTQVRIAAEQAQFDQNWAATVNVIEQSMDNMELMTGVIGAAKTFDDLRFISAVIGVDDERALALIKMLALASVGHACFEVYQRQQERKNDGE